MLFQIQDKPYIYIFTLFILASFRELIVTLLIAGQRFQKNVQKIAKKSIFIRERQKLCSCPLRWTKINLWTRK